MSSQIEDTCKVSKCSTCCQFHRAQLKEPMVIQELPNRPWAKIGSDLFEFNGAHYLPSVDYYSKWIEIAKLSNLNSNNVICHLKSQFAKYGIPDELISGNGPQYSSLAFKEFSNNYHGFVHTISSPKYPQANGEAELAVKTIESLLKKAQDPYKALLNYRRNRLIACTIDHGSQIENTFTNTCRPSKDTWSPRSQGTLSEKAERESLL